MNTFNSASFYRSLIIIIVGLLVGGAVGYAVGTNQGYDRGNADAVATQNQVVAVKAKAAKNAAAQAVNPFSATSSSASNPLKAINTNPLKKVKVNPF